MSVIGLGLESILRQNGSFFKELTEAIVRLRENRDYTTDGIKKSMLLSAIRAHTGFNISCAIVGGDNAASYVIAMSNFNGLFGYEFSGGSTASKSILDFNNNVINGLVNEATGKVGGDFSKVPVNIEISLSLIGHSSSFTPEESAAVIIHELGHTFSYFQFMGMCSYGAVLTGIAARDLLDSSSYKEREVIIKKLENTLGIDKIIKLDQLVETPKPGIEVILLAEYVSRLPEKTLNLSYDVRGAEQQADTFVVRHGAAAAHASALDKFHREFGSYGKPTFWGHLVAETSRLFNLAKVGVHMTDLIFGNVVPMRYDRPKDRLEYLKLQLISDLKLVPKNNNKLREQILRDIAAVEKVYNDAGMYRRDVVQFFWDVVNVRGKDLKKREDMRKALERMLYNDLFLKATQFKANT